MNGMGEGASDWSIRPVRPSDWPVMMPRSLLWLQAAVYTYLRQFESSTNTPSFCFWDKLKNCKHKQPFRDTFKMSGWQCFNLNSLKTFIWHSSELERDETKMWCESWRWEKCCEPPCQKSAGAVLCVDIVKLNIYMHQHIGHHNILAQGRASYFGFLRSSTHESVVLQCIEMLKCWLCTFFNRCCL